MKLLCLEVYVGTVYCGTYGDSTTVQQLELNSFLGRWGSSGCECYYWTMGDVVVEVWYIRVLLPVLTKKYAACVTQTC